MAKVPWLGGHSCPGLLGRTRPAPGCASRSRGAPRPLRHQWQRMVLPTASGPRSPIPPPLTTQVYYEDLVRCLPAQVDRLASFLGLPLTPAKRAAVLQGVSFDTMKSGGGMAGMLLRKGGAPATGNTRTLTLAVALTLTMALTLALILTLTLTLTAHLSPFTPT